MKKFISKMKELLTRNPCKKCYYYCEGTNICQSKKSSFQGGFGYVDKLDKMFCETYYGPERQVKIVNNYTDNNS
jgi:hypothetical protein